MWRAAGRPVVSEVVIGTAAGVEPDVGLAGVGAEGELGGVAVLLGGGDDAAFPAQVLAAECADVAGDKTAAHRRAGFSRTEKVCVGVIASICRMRWSAPVR